MTLALCKHLNCSPIRSQVALLCEYKDPHMLAQFRRHTRVACGSGFLALDADKLGSISRGVDIIVSNGFCKLHELRRDLHQPVVVVSHIAPDLEDQRHLLLSEATAADFLAAVSETAAKSFADSASVTILPPGIDVERLVPADDEIYLRQRWGLGIHDKVVLYVGRLAKEKSPGWMLDVIEALPPSWKLLMVGDGPLRAELAAQVRHMGLADRVRMIGQQFQVGSCYWVADVLVVPSASEAFSMAAIEGLLAGKRVVMLDNAISREFTQRHGELFSIASTPAGLADAVLEADTWDAEGPQRICMERYTAHAMALRWKTYLLSIMSTWLAR